MECQKVTLLRTPCKGANCYHSPVEFTTYLWAKLMAVSVGAPCP